MQITAVQPRVPFWHERGSAVYLSAVEMSEENERYSDNLPHHAENCFLCAASDARTSC